MGKLLNIITPLHKQAKRDYLARMNNDKAYCMKIARQYGKDFWDGDSRYGYGGYKYDGRWAAVAKDLIDYYNLPINAKILDVGCGKGFLLHEFKNILPKATVAGIDISEYAIMDSKEGIKPFLKKLGAQDSYPFADKEFDLVFSNTTLHNLYVFELKKSLQEIERVGKNKYICVESYRNVQELFNLQCWALTCEIFFNPQEWVWFFKESGYTGEYEFIYFE